jgi:tRNA modification GTPase
MFPYLFLGRIVNEIVTRTATYTPEDTIAAIATPVGSGGIGIVRLSGANALPILQRIFRPGDQPFVPRALTYGHIVDPGSDQVVDEVLAVYMPAPRTYTRQDVVEIDCHAGPVPLRRVLDLCLQEGARLARPGEFTLRAFLNGRIDLAQAEAVADLVEAKTEAGLRMAVAQLEGRLSGRIRQVRAQLLNALSRLEAGLDFDEDEIPLYPIAQELCAALKALDDLLARADQGIIYRQGARAAIVGRPNVGKSSLLNALLRADRAIVTHIPGTTRDTLEETLNLNGIPLVLVDTAGIRSDARDLIEGLGIERSRAALAQADLALLVVDASVPLVAQDAGIAALIGDKPAIVVINKIDLPVVAQADGLLPHVPRVAISALTGEGIEALERAIEGAVLAGHVTVAEDALAGNARHRDVLRRARQRVEAAMATCRAGLPADFVSVDLAEAVDALGEITGETVHDTLLETIFSRFCIGK